MTKKQTKKECMKEDCDEEGVEGTPYCCDEHLNDDDDDGVRTTVSVNGSEPKPMGSPESKAEITEMIKKHVGPKQVDLEMNPLPELDAEEETEIVNYVVMRCKGFSFRIKSEAFEKLVTKNKKENVEEHHDRILRTVQGRVKIISKEFPAVHGDYDAATERIYERVLEQVS